MNISEIVALIEELQVRVSALEKKVGALLYQSADKTE